MFGEYLFSIKSVTSRNHTKYIFRCHKFQIVNMSMIDKNDTFSFQNWKCFGGYSCVLLTEIDKTYKLFIVKQEGAIYYSYACLNVSAFIGIKIRQLINIRSKREKEKAMVSSLVHHDTLFTTNDALMFFIFSKDCQTSTCPENPTQKWMHRNASFMKFLVYMNIKLISVSSLRY